MPGDQVPWSPAPPPDEVSESSTLLGDTDDDQHGSISSREYASLLASRVFHSRSCGAFYASLLAASLTEIVWIMHPWVEDGVANCCKIAYPKSPVFFAVEVYLTVGLVLETVLRAVSQGATFCSDAGNVFDATVCCLSIVSFALFVEHTSEDLEARARARSELRAPRTPPTHL